MFKKSLTALVGAGSILFAGGAASAQTLASPAAALSVASATTEFQGEAASGGIGSGAVIGAGVFLVLVFAVFISNDGGGSTSP